MTLSRKTKIAIQGEVGSFSHEAARRMAPGCAIVPCARSAEVFDRVERGSVSAAVIPIENSLAGSVTEHFDLLLARKVFIEQEFRLRIVHNLIVPPGVRLKDLSRAYSHPVALEQCRDFFRHHPRIQPTPFYDTAGSVKHVIATGLRDSAESLELKPRRPIRGVSWRPESRTISAILPAFSSFAGRAAFCPAPTRLRLPSA